jgi:hypothetical protein
MEETNVKPEAVTEPEGELLTAPDADRGRWFPWRGDAAFLVRRVPRHKLREFEVQAYGKELMFLSGGGTKLDRNKVEKYRLLKASYALLDSRKVKQLRKLLAGTELEHGDGDRVLLDGKWTQAVKDAVFRETNLAGEIEEMTDEMSSMAAEEVAASEQEKD